MSRLDVRCKVDLPVSVVHGNGHGTTTEKNATFSVLSLNGAYIGCKQAVPNRKIVGLRYELPKHGEFEMLGEVIRKDKKGMAVKFHNVNRDTRIKLWDYIRDNIQESARCPYCASENPAKVRNCVSCGWSLNFSSPDYLINHEKESFVRRLTTRSSSFSIEDIYKILNFIDVEILGVGKSLEINEEFVGSSRSMLEVFSMIRKAAPAEFPVHITGENGTGKEMTARAIHERSSRKENPFISVDCAAMKEELLEAELFGYEKGVIPGMNRPKPGKLEDADTGTIFIDHISELPARLQDKLAKFLENGIIERVGAKGGRPADVRVITAAGKSLKPAIADEKFSRDLFNRLNAFSINLFPLRDRGEDKLILARYFLNKFAREMNVSKTFTKEALAMIKNYDWPGNVREMINKIRMAVIMSPEMEVTNADLDLRIPAADMESITSLRDVRGAIEKQKLIEALNICNNNISKTAKVLGISRPSVYSLKKKYEI